MIDEELVRCGVGTRAGELLRRYWQPIALSSLVASLPVQVKVLGEELVLFRDGRGDCGLLYPRCMHRGTSLLYGKVERDGIRCCYHGWKFDIHGHCIDRSCEPDGMANASVRQPWYPVVERHGLVFAYMGPPDREPAFPEFAVAQDLGEDETLVAVHSTSSPNGPTPKLAAQPDYNWWQAFDNFSDPFHVMVIHHMINGTQFVENLGILPDVKFEYTVDGDGVRSIQHRRLPDGTIHQRISQVGLPNLHFTPGITDNDLGKSNMGWLVPSDDTHYQHFILKRIKRGSTAAAFLDEIGMMRDHWGPSHGKSFNEWSLEDHQRWQTDYEAQKGQGDISFHSEEHLSTTDAGIAMMRRLFRKQAAAVAGGQDPIGVKFDEGYRMKVSAGNALLDPTMTQCVAGFDGR
jgi:phenylpropionate dioxygenase-like ring-hydroxylating dioxygenase large terminal subunit